MADRQVNTALQLCLMGLTLINPLLPIPTTTSLTALQWVAFLSLGAHTD
jgi:hypothetical protein